MPGVAFIRERERTQQDRAVPSGCCAGLRPWPPVVPYCRHGGPFEPLTFSMRTSGLGRSPPMAALA